MLTEILKHLFYTFEAYRRLLEQSNVVVADKENIRLLVSGLGLEEVVKLLTPLVVHLKREFSIFTGAEGKGDRRCARRSVNRGRRRARGGHVAAGHLDTHIRGRRGAIDGQSKARRPSLPSHPLPLLWNLNNNRIHGCLKQRD